jgi:hypothetical protein
MDEKIGTIVGYLVCIKQRVMKNYFQQQKEEEIKKFGFDQALIELGLYIIPTTKKVKVTKC